MSYGALPRVDKQLLHAETWLHHRLGERTGTEHFLLLRRFGLWHQVPSLRTRARARPLTPASRRFAAEQFTRGGAVPGAGLTNVAVSLRPAPRPTSTPGTPGIATTRPALVGPSWSGPWPTATRRD